MDYTKVIGQHATVQRLQDMINAGHVPHALMLTGPSGNGKMALVLAMASQMLGQRVEGKSILRDEAAVANAEAMLSNWQHPDLHFVFPVFRPKGASAGYKPVSDDFLTEWRELLRRGPYFTLEDWGSMAKVENQQMRIYEGESDVLNRKLSLKAAMGGYKVVVVWLPERMNEVCANKLLKLIEEPPQQTHFIMACEAPEKLLPTIRSRVQRMEVPRIDTADMERAAMEQMGLEATVARTVAHAAEGSWLRALEMTSTESERKAFLDLYKTLMRRAFARDIKGLKQWSELVNNMGRERTLRFLDYLMQMTRECFVYNFQQPELVYLMPEENQFATQFARFVNERNVVEMAELTQRTIREIGQNANGKMVLFNLSLKMIILLRR